MSAGYGLTEIAPGLSLRAGAAQTSALLGANGADRTTLMMTLAGTLPATPAGSA